MKQERTTEDRDRPLACRTYDFLDHHELDGDLERLFERWWSYLDDVRSRELNVTGPLHLVSLDRPIHALARRAVVFSDPAVRARTEVSPHASVERYHGALSRLCFYVFAAMKAGRVTPRDDLLGAPAPLPALPQFDAWLKLNSAVHDGDVVAVKELLSTSFEALTDQLFPSIMVDVPEFSQWASSERIAAEGEVERLLATDAARGGTPGNAQGRPTTDEIWKSKARAYATEIYRRDKALGCDPSKHDIATEIAKRFDEERVRGARVRLSAETIVRHALKDWQRPA